MDLFLELVVQNHVFELQNNELEINLNLRAKMNQMLSNKLMDMKKELTDNGITFDSEDEKEDEMVKEFNKLRQMKKLGGSPHPSSNPHIHYPPISAKKASFVQPIPKFTEINRIKRTSTVEKINQSRVVNEGSLEIDRSRAETLRKQNRLAQLVKIETNDPYKQIEVKGSNYLKKLPPYKPQFKQSNSPPRQEYRKEEAFKDELPVFVKGKPAPSRGQENQDGAHNFSGLGIHGAGIPISREIQKPTVCFDYSRAKLVHIYPKHSIQGEATDRRTLVNTTNSLN